MRLLPCLCRARPLAPYPEDADVAALSSDVMKAFRREATTVAGPSETRCAFRPTGTSKAERADESRRGIDEMAPSLGSSIAPPPTVTPVSLPSLPEDVVVVCVDVTRFPLLLPSLE